MKTSKTTILQTVAAVSLALSFLVPVGLTFAAPAVVRDFSVVISPTTATTSLSQSYTVRLTNDSASTKDIEGIRIAIPSGFTSVSTAAISGNVTGWSDISTTTEEIWVRNDGGASNKIQNGEHADITFTALAPAATGNYVWSTRASEKKAFDDSTKEFTIISSQPSVQVAEPISHISLVKFVVNDNGGSAGTSAWTLTATGPTTTISGLTGSVAVTNAPILSGTYLLSESVGPDGYSAGDWVCIGGIQNGASITLDEGQNATCTITNDDRAGSITVVTNIVNPDGDEVADNHNFNTSLGETSTTTFEGSTTVFGGLSAGQHYVVTQGVDEDYGDVTYSADCDIASLTLGQDATCTITTKQKQGQLTVIKNVSNHAVDDTVIGTSDANDFSFSLNGLATTTFSAEDGAMTGQNVVSVNPGTYVVAESGPDGYAGSFTDSQSGACANITIASNGTATCTINNSDIVPLENGAITVIKRIVRDNGGESIEASSFTLRIAPTEGEPATVTSGQANFLAPNTYTISEDSPASLNYEQSGDVVCTDGDTTTTDGTVELVAQRAWVCTITNTDIAPKLTLIKQVVNDNGGTATTSAWTLIASSTEDNSVGINGQGFAVSGATFQAGTYSLSEIGTPEGYDGGEWSCSKNGDEPVSGNSITLGIGDVAVCRITNDDEPATLTIVKHTSQASGDGTFNFTVSPISEGESSNTSLSTDGGFATTSEGISLNAGVYNVTESSLEGWRLKSTNCVYENSSIGESLPEGGEQITIGNGDHVVCTFINERLGTLVVRKVVVNNNSGTASAGDFSFKVDGGENNLFGRVEEESSLLAERRMTVAAGVHNVTEAESDGYTASYDNCTNVNVPAGGEATCTITNDDNAPASIVVESTVDVLARAKANGNGPVGGGGTSNVGQVLGVSTSASGGSASTTCSNIITQIPMVMGFNNDPSQVRVLQNFLNSEMKSGLPITGFYGPLTKAAVASFQLKYWQDVLAPWVKFGLPTDHTTTGRVSKTTGWKINKISCPVIDTPFPVLP